MDLSKKSTYTLVPVEKPVLSEEFTILLREDEESDPVLPENVLELIPPVWRHGLDSFKKAA